MLVVVVPESGVDFSQLDYSGGVYKYDTTSVEKSFKRFTLEFIDDLNLLYKAAGRKPIRELPDYYKLWKPIMDPSVVYEYRGYLKISTPSALNTYSVYVLSDIADGRFYSWKKYRFDKIFNNTVEEQCVDRYVCRVFSTAKCIDTITIYAKNPEDLRVRLRGMFNKDGHLKQVSTSDDSNTSFGELFYTDSNRLVYVIMAEKKDD